MKNIRILFTLIVSSLFTLACNAGPDSDSTKTPVEAQVRALNESVDALSKKLESLDSCVSHIPDSIQINEYERKISGCVKDIDDLRSDVTKLSKERSIIAYVPTVMSLVALILSIIVFVSIRRKKSGKSSGEHHSANDIDQVKTAIPSTPMGYQPSHQQDKINKMQEQIDKMQRMIKNIKEETKFAIGEHTKKISMLERSNIQPPAPATGGSFLKQCLYAQTNDGEWLSDISSSKKETSVFVVETESGNKGTLDIVNFNQMKQQNGWESIVKHDGGNIANAINYQVVEKGLCEKHGDLWKVVKPLKIRIS